MTRELVSAARLSASETLKEVVIPLYLSAKTCIPGLGVLVMLIRRFGSISIMCAIAWVVLHLFHTAPAIVVARFTFASSEWIRPALADAILNESSSYSRSVYV